MRILGLDISSTTIGLSVVKEEFGKFYLDHFEYFKPDKSVGLFESLLNVRKWIIERLETLKPDFIAIEEIAQHFDKYSSAHTIITLAIYNRTVGLAVFEYLGKEPTLINVSTARSLIKPKGYKGKLAKEDVPDVVAAIMGIDFPWIKKKRVDKPADESYDVADSMAIALAFGGLKVAKNDKQSGRSIRRTRTKPRSK